MELKPQTLIVAIQCVAAEIKAIDKQLQDGDPPNAGELEQLLLAYDLAADDLKDAYEAAQDRWDGLPVYEDLLKRV